MRAKTAVGPLTLEQFRATREEITPVAAYKHRHYIAEDEAKAVLFYAGMWVIEDLGEGYVNCSGMNTRYYLLLPDEKDLAGNDLADLEKKLYLHVALEMGWRVADAPETWNDTARLDWWGEQIDYWTLKKSGGVELWGPGAKSTFQVYGMFKTLRDAINAARNGAKKEQNR